MMRTHYCGTLTEAQIDQTVTLCGWVHRRRDHGGVIFLDMRDRDGLVQVVIDPDTPEAFSTADGRHVGLHHGNILRFGSNDRYRPPSTTV